MERIFGITPAYAQDAGGTAAVVMQLLPLVLIFVVFYFLLIRPQQKKMKNRPQCESDRCARHDRQRASPRSRE